MFHFHPPKVLSVSLAPLKSSQRPHKMQFKLMFFKPFSSVITSLKLWVQKWRICETCEFWPSGAQSLTYLDDITLVVHSVTNIANVKQKSECRDCELVDVPQELGELQGLRELHLQVKFSTEDCETITCLLKRTLDWDNQREHDAPIIMQRW